MDMNYLSVAEHKCGWKRAFFIRSLVMYGILTHPHKLFSGLVVNGQLLNPVEAKSSPSHITATKGSSLWLHWNYTYIGDGPSGALTIAYKEQIIGWNSTSQPTVQALAKRTGQNGALALESPTPAPFSGRAEVISSNSTLVIHNLPYNDSTCQFSSNVTLDINTGRSILLDGYNLKPVVSLTVNGIPDFIKQPPSTLDVNEGSNLILRIEMDGNPKPSADFRWPHLTSSSAANVPSAQLHPFVYSSTYTLNTIDASYCGRILQTTLRNAIGSSSVKSTNVTVLLKLDVDYGLKAGKDVGDRCVNVRWNKVEGGACYVKYKVVLRNASGGYQYSDSGYNIGEMTMCSFATFSNVTDVQLTVSFKATSTNVTANVFDTPISTSTPTPPETTTSSLYYDVGTSLSSPGSGSSGNPAASPNNDKKASGSSTGVIVGASVGGIIFLILVIILIFWLIKKPKRSNSTDYPPQEENCAMAGEVNRKQPLDPNYTDPNKSTLIYGKLGESTKDRPKHRKGKRESDNADVKVDEAGYPAAGPVPTAFTDGSGYRS